MEQQLLARSWDDVGTNLFVPEHYEFSDQGQIQHFVSENPMAHVITSTDDNIRLTNAPMLWPEGNPKTTECLWGHIASRNSQTSLIHAGAKAVLLFNLPGTYISPRWFTQTMTAPTWSYVSLQIRGCFVPINDDIGKIRILRRTVEHMETVFSPRADDNTPCPKKQMWNMDALTAEQMERYLGMITAFEFQVNSIEGVRRLNQDKSMVEMQNIQEKLTTTPQRDADTISAMMKANMDALIK